MKQNYWHVCILIPAHNEEALLPRCLHSVRAACARLPENHTFDIVLTVDSSTDQTLRIAQKIIGTEGTILKSNKKNVGYARKLAANKGIDRCPGSLNQCWLANTDADCEVPLNWLTDQLKLANTGIQGVAGIVHVDSFSEHSPHVAKQFLQEYLINPDGTHPHVHGANLGVRADAYQIVGGWNELKTAEDHDLWNRLSAQKIPMISDAKLFVFTSGRKTGRAPHGFAQTLASLNGDSA